MPLTGKYTQLNFHQWIILPFSLCQIGMDTVYMGKPLLFRGES